MLPVRGASTAPSIFFTPRSPPTMRCTCQPAAGFLRNNMFNALCFRAIATASAAATAATARHHCKQDVRIVPCTPTEPDSDDDERGDRGEDNPHVAVESPATRHVLSDVVVALRLTDALSTFPVRTAGLAMATSSVILALSSLHPKRHKRSALHTASLTCHTCAIECIRHGPRHTSIGDARRPDGTAARVKPRQSRRRRQRLREARRQRRCRPRPRVSRRPRRPQRARRRRRRACAPRD
jgi:hypothetical protein